MLACSTMAFAWGQKGHDVVAYIAEQHLTPTTQATVNEIFNGKSLVYWANWLDNASHTPEYAYTKTWHYKNINAGVAYEDMTPHPKGDVVYGIKLSINNLLSKNADIDSSLYLKILVHLVGDMHQPMHMGHATDLGGNKVTVKHFGRNTNLHSLWDGALLEGAHKWSYSEWQIQIDRLSPQEESAIVNGKIDDWAKETLSLATMVYDTTPEGSNIAYDEIAAAAPIIEQQLLRGGLRLAHILNMIFDADYAASH